LLGFVLGVSRGALLTLDQLSDAAASAAQSLVDRRVDEGFPVAYLIGRRDFYDLSLTVDERVLIPRPETETLVETFASLDERGRVPPGAVVDWGTGSGAVALVTARRRPVLAIDRSWGALELASINVAACRVPGWQAIQLARCDGLSAVLPGTLAAVLANPPYIEAEEWAGLPADVRHEPLSALVPRGGDVATLYSRLAAEAAVALKPGGWLLTEIGWTQGSMVAQACTRATLSSVDVLQDLAGLDRVVVAQRPVGSPPRQPTRPNTG
jgi:release factor glutamine methyltransferase